LTSAGNSSVIPVLDEAGRNGIYQDVPAGHLPGERFGEGVQGSLFHRVWNLPGLPVWPTTLEMLMTLPLPWWTMNWRMIRLVRYQVPLAMFL